MGLLYPTLKYTGKLAIGKLALLFDSSKVSVGSHVRPLLREVMDHPMDPTGQTTKAWVPVEQTGFHVHIVAFTPTDHSFVIESFKANRHKVFTQMILRP
jgi:hypothetical protein